jgi:hypothetical protein
MSFDKIAQNEAQIDICENWYVSLSVEKCSRNIWDTSVFLNKVPEVYSRSEGKNSPNLVSHVFYIEQS